MPLFFSRMRHRLFYGWVVLIASLIIGTVVLGTRHSFGVFFTSLESDFGLSRGVTSGVFSVYMALCGLFAILGGWAFDRYGPRVVILNTALLTGLSLLLTSQTRDSWQLFISYSLLLAIGTGGTATVLIAMASRWFETRRGFAVGVAGSGGGLGTLVMAPFAAYLISNLGWRNSYIVMGLIVWLVVAPLSLLLRKHPGDLGLLADGAKPASGKIEVLSKEENARRAGFPLRTVLHTGQFWLLWFTMLITSSCAHLITIHIIPYAIDLGFSTMQAAGVLSMIGASTVLGRSLAGRASDAVGRKVVAIISGLIGVVALIWVIWLKDLWMLYLFAAAAGLFWGGLSTMVIAVTGDVFGIRNIGTLVGAQNIALVLGAAIGPLIGGFVFDVRNDYSAAFLAGALGMLVVTLLSALIRGKTDGGKRNI